MNELETLPEELKINILHFVGVKMLYATPSATIFHEFMGNLNFDNSNYEDDYPLQLINHEQEKAINLSECSLDDNYDYDPEFFEKEKEDYYKEKESSMWNKWKHILLPSMMKYHHNNRSKFCQDHLRKEGIWIYDPYYKGEIDWDEINRRNKALEDELESPPSSPPPSPKSPPPAPKKKIKRKKKKKNKKL
jgi:hypothetical protein